MRRMPAPVRLIVLATHPVQYRAPLYRHLAAQDWLELEVWYGDTYGVTPTTSLWGVKDFRWDTDLLTGYEHRFLPNKSLTPGPFHRFGALNPSLIPAFRRAAPDAALVSGYSQAFHWTALAAAMSMRVPVLYTSDSNALAEPTGLKGRVKHALVERLYRRISAFLVSGATNDRHYAQYDVPENKRFFFPWAVDNAFFARQADAARRQRGEVRESWNVQKGRTVLLFAGVLLDRKRPFDLVDAVARGEGIHVVFAGSGPEEARLREYAAEKVGSKATFLGFVPQTELPKVYASADLLVIPSSYEPWGLVVNEALACGTPAIASNAVGAAYDLVHPALRYPCGDVETLVRAVEIFRERRDEISRWSTARLERFDFSVDAAGLREALSSALRRVV
ncbi:MAG: glycosyltransferase family 1 protein [Myxococcales bacterium]|nr:glycosyltransferase family 1 protein [Myxococcales bacterium]